MNGDRLFDGLPPWSAPDESAERRIATVRTFVDQRMHALGSEPQDNPRIPAGYTYLAQFVDHDVTVDLPSMAHGTSHGPRRGPGFGPGLRLDSVYGRGPLEQPYLYDTARTDRRGFPGYFLIGAGDNRNEPDLARNRLGRALIGDMRNDCGLILSQLHLAVMQLHNRVLEVLVGSDAAASEAQFREARRIVRWFYQYVVWNDLTRRLVLRDVHQRVLSRGRGGYEYLPLVARWSGRPTVPAEFRHAAYRTRLAMIRSGYRINSTSDHADIERPPAAPAGSGAFDLRGFRPLPSSTSVEWDLFVALPSSPPGFPQASRRLGLGMTALGYRLPNDRETPSSQALATILRGCDAGLPAGSAVARALDREPLPVVHSAVEDALWVYLLREAEAGGGITLGEIGSEIVAGVIAGLLYGDPSGYLRCAPAWTPARELTLGCPRPVDREDWGMADLLYASGAPLSASDVDRLVSGARHRGPLGGSHAGERSA